MAQLGGSADRRRLLNLSCTKACLVLHKPHRYCSEEFSVGSGIESRLCCHDTWPHLGRGGGQRGPRQSAGLCSWQSCEDQGSSRVWAGRTQEPWGMCPSGISTLPSPASASAGFYPLPAEQREKLGLKSRTVIYFHSCKICWAETD